MKTLFEVALNWIVQLKCFGEGKKQYLYNISAMFESLTLCQRICVQCKLRQKQTRFEIIQYKTSPASITVILF